MKTILATAAMLVWAAACLAQGSGIKIDITTQNPSPAINDAVARAIVTGARQPVEYHWSNTQTATTDAVSTGITEGMEYTLQVVDADGETASTAFTIPANGLSEKINAWFIPIVNRMASIVLCDVFAVTGMYDNTIRDSDGNPVLYPNGTPMRMRIPFVVVWLIVGALFCTIYMGFPNIRCFRRAVTLVRGRYEKKDSQGEVSHFQALATALSATVGLGNIAGVAMAISTGGPGAAFWLLVAGFLGMASKFAECTLGVKYRKVNPDGTISGGGMYYVPAAFTKHGMPKLGKALGYIVAAMIISGGIGGGCLFEANQTFAQMAVVFPSMKDHGALFGIIMAAIVAIATTGGIKRIAKVTGVVVPTMAIIYVVSALAVILMNITRLPEAVSVIIDGAFSPEAMRGGVIGVVIIGFQRAALSNEAGIGSSPIAHAAVKTDNPVSEGIVALLEPFIDTVVICSMTALVIVFSGAYQTAGAHDGIQLTSTAFAGVFDWFPYVLLVSIILFAFSTSITWNYYSLQAFRFIFGGVIKNETVLRVVFQVFFLSFLVIGAASSMGYVMDMTDLMYMCLCFPNFLAIYLMAKEIKGDLKGYMGWSTRA